MLLAVVADDLTGAADAAAPFATAGRQARVVLDGVIPGDQPGPTPGGRGGVVAVSTDSRRLDPAAAAERVAGVCRALRGAEVFKKIDSTLRGNVAAETRAAAHATGAEKVVVCPAFPAMGRTVVDGTLHLWGRPLARVADHVPAGSVVVDARDDADLDAVAARRGSGVLLVGSGGLAAAVARAGVEPRAPAPGTGLPASRPGAVVVVAGSASDVTRAQVGRLTDCTVIAVARELAERAVRSCAGSMAGLVVSGGDTAAAVLAALGACAVDLGGELEPGVPVGRIVGGTADGVPLVLKSGGFGTERTLQEAVEWLRR